MSRLEQKMSAPDFWQDQQGAQKMLQRRKRLEGDLGFLKRLRSQEDDTRVLVRTFVLPGILALRRLSADPLLITETAAAKPLRSSAAAKLCTAPPSAVSTCGHIRRYTPSESGVSSA